MLPRRAVTAHTLAALWCPRGRLLAELAHVPVSRARGVVCLNTEQRQRLRSKHSPGTSSRDATTRAPGAALQQREMAAAASTADADADAGAGLRSEFLQVLRSRGRDLQGQPLSLPPDHARARACCSEISRWNLNVQNPAWCML
jgi:hypothetical protein